MAEAPYAIERGHRLEDRRARPVSALLPSRWARRVVIFALVAGGFSALLAGVPLPPTIMADNCQILLAVDRLSLGLGPTTIYPRLPEVDWALITHWPVGYPLLIWAVKSLTGLGTIPACHLINIAAFALALIAWVAWARRCLPASRPADLLALTVGVLALAPQLLWQAAGTDMIIVALTPVMLLWTIRLTGHGDADVRPAWRRRWLHYALLGLGVGSVVWIRYHGIYLALGIGLFLLLAALLRHGPRLRHVLLFGAGCSLPVGLLLAVNATWGPSAVDRPAGGFSLTWRWDWVVQWWHSFTLLPLFDSHWRSSQVWSVLVPLAATAVLLSRRSFRRAARSFFARPPVLLSACAVGGVLVLLLGFRVVADALYAPPHEPRYLLPVRPLYLLFFVGPLMVLPSPTIRRLVCLPLLACLVWLIQAGWADAARFSAAHRRPVTAYGRAAVCFQHGADELYAWLRDQDGSDLIVFSNFFDSLALETHLPAQPLPYNVEELRDRVRRIAHARDYPEPRVLFVLEPDNQWRQYYLDAHEAMRMFDLRRVNSPNPAVARYVYTPRGGCPAEPPVPIGRPVESTMNRRAELSEPDPGSMGRERR